MLRFFKKRRRYNELNLNVLRTTNFCNHEYILLMRKETMYG